MNTINIAADATAQRIGIGNQYENEATAVVFDCSQFAEDHGAGTAQIIHRRPTESIGYVCTNVSQTNNTVTWLVTDDDTSFTGKGQVQLRWYVNDVLRESVIFPTYILPSVTSSGDAPEDVKSAVEKLMEYIQDNTISTEDLDERIANYFYDHPLPMEGEADGLVAGSAKQLLSESYTLDQVPYLFRKSPDSDRAVEEIVGGTVWWNQLVRNGNFADTSGWSTNISNSTLSANGNILTLTLGENATVSSSLSRTSPLSDIVGHVYMIRIDVKPSRDTQVMFSFLQKLQGIKRISCPANAWTTAYTIGLSIATGGKVWYISDPATLLSGETVQFKNAQYYDLTTMFGSTIADYIYALEQSTAGAGVAKLKEWGFFTEDYYEYCEPTLRSVEGLVSKKTVGFNQWDEEWENGAIDLAYGTDSASSTNVRSKYFRVLPSTEYYVHNPGVSSTSAMIIFWYDSSKSYISYAYCGNKAVSSPNNASYARFYMGTVYGTTYNHDICINLSDPTRNGQYEPYESHTYSLDSTLTLRGVPKLDSNNNLYFDGDIYPADGQGKRRYTERAYQSGDESLADAITDGTTTVVKLSTPTTFTAQPYHNPQIVGDTEEFVTTGIVPVGHSTKYYQNLRKKIEDLPWNFSSLIAPTEATNKATRNYTAGSYLILNNVLYKVTSNIANGGNITPNTNVTATTIMAEFMSL